MLLGAADSARIGQDQASTNQTEDLSDGTYNIRFPGLNVDLMSYTSLAMVQNNNSALLDPSILSNVSSAVFSRFFQHFVQASIAGETSKTMGFQTVTDPVTIQARLLTATTELDFNPAAVIISLAILGFLLVTAIIIVSLNRQILKLLPRDVDTLGSVLGFVYGSDRLLRAAAESSNIDFNEKHTEGDGEMAKLGWFNGNGRRRWGIEITSSREGGALMAGALSPRPSIHSPRMPGSGENETARAEEPEGEVEAGHISGSRESMSRTVSGVGRRLRGESFDTYEAIADMALRTPPRPAARFPG